MGLDGDVVFAGWVELSLFVYIQLRSLSYYIY